MEVLTTIRKAAQSPFHQLKNPQTNLVAGVCIRLIVVSLLENSILFHSCKLLNHQHAYILQSGMPRRMLLQNFARYHEKRMSACNFHFAAVL